MTTNAIITVTTTTPADQLDGDDQDIAGTYGIAMGEGVGEHSKEPRNAVGDNDDPRREAALDVFHDRIGIAVLDDFDIGVKLLAEGEDVPEGVRWL